MLPAPWQPLAGRIDASGEPPQDDDASMSGNGEPESDEDDASDKSNNDDGYLEGIVKFYKREKSYGFVTVGKDRDVFVH